MTTYSEFVAAIERFDPVPLLGRLAGVSARQLTDQVPGAASPWAVASIARESLAYGVDGGLVPTEADIIDLGRIHHNLQDPYVDEHLTDDDGLDNVTLRYLYEQMPFRHAVEREHQRSLALFDRDYSALPRPCQVLSQAAWAEALGRPIGVVLRSAVIIRTLAAANGGSFDPDWLRRPAHSGLLEDAGVIAGDVEFVFNEFFVADYTDMRQRAAEPRKENERRNEDERLRRLDFNPLAEHPFVRLPDGRCIAPSVHLVAKRLGPTSLYHLGNTHWPRPDNATSGATPFSGDAGEVIEAYVGELLAPTNLQLFPERPYEAKGGSTSKTADFVVGQPDITVVFEVKSARVNVASRLSFAAYLKDVLQDVGKAINQINTTGQMIYVRHKVFPERFAKNIRGIVITDEPHYLLNSKHYREASNHDPMTRTRTTSRLPKTNYPTTVMSLEELENAVELIAKTGSVELLDLLTTHDKNGIDVGKVISDYRYRA